MTRVLIVIAVLSAIVVGVYWIGGKDAMRDHRETTIKREKDIGDAVRDSDADVSWRDWLLQRND